MERDGVKGVGNLSQSFHPWGPTTSDVTSNVVTGRVPTVYHPQVCVTNLGLDVTTPSAPGRGSSSRRSSVWALGGYRSSRPPSLLVHGPTPGTTSLDPLTKSGDTVNLVSGAKVLKLHSPFLSHGCPFDV